MEQTSREKIYEVLHTCKDLNWHAWHWWKGYDAWFEQFDPAYIDSIAKKMADEGIIETDGLGYRRKERTFKERLKEMYLKVWG